jgi:hypothetical protein
MALGSPRALDGMSVLPEIRRYHRNTAGTLSTMLNLQDGGFGKPPRGGSKRKPSPTSDPQTRSHAQGRNAICFDTHRPNEIVDLKGKSVPERARALIDLAHPDFRKDLGRHARAYRLIGKTIF